MITHCNGGVDWVVVTWNPRISLVQVLELVATDELLLVYDSLLHFKLIGICEKFFHRVKVIINLPVDCDILIESVSNINGTELNIKLDELTEQSW